MFSNPLQGIGGRRPMPVLFQSLTAYPSVFCGRQNIDYGDKILLPSSMLQKTFNLNLKGVMIFCIQNPLMGRHTYCGVLQFVADEGMCYLPSWMFRQLQLFEGQKVNITLITDMPKGNFVKFRPHKTQFINFPNPKALLENQLRNFTCLHAGDTITIGLRDRSKKTTFDIDIVQIKPKNDYQACCIINTALVTDFQAPLDYVEPQKPAPKKEIAPGKKSVFQGSSGVRFDGKPAQASRKMSEAYEQLKKQQDYDPRKHRLPRGVRVNQKKLFEGKAIKYG